MIGLKYIGYNIFHTFSRFSLNWIGSGVFLSLFTLHTNWTLLHLLHEMNSFIHLKGNLNVTISNSTYCLMFYCSVLWCDCICYYYYYCYSKVLFLYSTSGLLYKLYIFLPTPFESRTGPVDICIGGRKCYILCVLHTLLHTSFVCKFPLQ